MNVLRGSLSEVYKESKWHNRSSAESFKNSECKHNYSLKISMWVQGGEQCW